MRHGRKKMDGGGQRSGSEAVRGVAADAKRSAGAGDEGTDRPGQRCRRKHPGPFAAAAGHRAHHLPVAASLREPGFGRLAQSTTLWASAAETSAKELAVVSATLRKPKAATHWSARRLAKGV